ncbi:hypothetical protein QVD17_01056 [Tagetes erecta]|uniref:F-box domain-containing protein n=1 Tax=Tagetes erecta TaxID=13708 RepID=A0AAD8LCS7_TARER|nr:hypothetical protein QVD17_01056 [Tagetes erecta]
MAEAADDDVLGKILTRLDVKELIRCKSVCKSWYSFITCPRFINRHLNLSYNEDRDDSEHSGRRIFLVQKYYCGYIPYVLVGSSNGLVCLISYHLSQVLVCNPWTREVRQLNPPPFSMKTRLFKWGFGYDSSTDDYKVIVGTGRRKNTRLQMLSLKSNTWSFVMDVKYTFMTVIGFLCNGALHWLVEDEENERKFIIAYNLAKNEFTEIQLPNDERYGSRYTCPGVINGYLCMHQWNPHRVWVMKKYNVTESWELLPQPLELQPLIIHYMKASPDIVPHESLVHSSAACFLKENLPEFICSHTFVRSLVSPMLMEAEAAHE